MKSSTLFRLLAVTILATGAFLAPLPPDASAAPPYTRLIDYYSDATYTHVVGTCWRGCNGAQSCDGQTSAYYVTERDYAGCGTSSLCCSFCSTGPCPAIILNNYPCPQAC